MKSLFEMLKDQNERRQALSVIKNTMNKKMAITELIDNIIYDLVMLLELDISSGILADKYSKPIIIGECYISMAEGTDKTIVSIKDIFNNPKLMNSLILDICGLYVKDNFDEIDYFTSLKLSNAHNTRGVSEADFRLLDGSVRTFTGDAFFNETTRGLSLVTKLFDLSSLGDEPTDTIEELDNYLVCSYLNNKLYPEKKGDKNVK